MEDTTIVYSNFAVKSVWLFEPESKNEKLNKSFVCNGVGVLLLVGTIGDMIGNSKVFIALSTVKCKGTSCALRGCNGETWVAWTSGKCIALISLFVNDY